MLEFEVFEASDLLAPLRQDLQLPEDLLLELEQFGEMLDQQGLELAEGV